MEQVRIDDDSRSGERLFVPLTAAPRDLGSHGIVGHALDEADPSVAELQQVIRGVLGGDGEDTATLDAGAGLLPDLLYG